MWMLLHGFTGGPPSWSSVVERAALDTEPSMPDLAGHGPSWQEYRVERFEDEVDRLRSQRVIG